MNAHVASTDTCRLEERRTVRACPADALILAGLDGPIGMDVTREDPQLEHWPSLHIPRWTPNEAGHDAHNGRPIDSASTVENDHRSPVSVSSNPITHPAIIMPHSQIPTPTKINTVIASPPTQSPTPASPRPLYRHTRVRRPPRASQPASPQSQRSSRPTRRRAAIDPTRRSR